MTNFPTTESLHVKKKHILKNTFPIPIYFLTADVVCLICFVLYLQRNGKCKKKAFVQVYSKVYDLFGNITCL